MNRACSFRMIMLVKMSGRSLKVLVEDEIKTTFFLTHLFRQAQYDVRALSY